MSEGDALLDVTVRDHEDMSPTTRSSCFQWVTLHCSVLPLARRRLFAKPGVLVCLCLLLCCVLVSLLFLARPVEPLRRWIVAEPTPSPSSGASASPPTEQPRWRLFSADDTRFVYSYGRVDWTRPFAPAFDWAGVHVSFIATNTTFISSLLVTSNRMDPKVIFAIHMNNERIGVIVVVDDTTVHHSIAEGLDPSKTYVVTLVRLTEPQGGVTHFQGLHMDEGGVLLPPDGRIQPPLHRKIEFLGDSITAGYGILGLIPRQPVADMQDIEMTYGALTAASINAEYHIEAWSGKGLVRNGFSDTTGRMMPQLFRYTLANQEIGWDFSTWIPDAVVVNLGSNDYSRNPSPALFDDGFHAFLSLIRSFYPNTPIFVACGPMERLCNRECCHTIEQVVQDERKENHHVYFVNLQGTANPYRIFMDDEGWEAGLMSPKDPGHPSASVHHVMAQNLTSALNKQLGW